MRRALRFKSIKIKMLWEFGIVVSLAGLMRTLNYYTIKESTLQA